MKGNAVEWLTKLHPTLVIKDYGKGSVRNYCQEMTLLFKYYNHKAVADIRQEQWNQSIGKNKTGSHIFIRLPTEKPQKTPYCNSYFFLPGVAEHRVAKSPGLKGCGALLFFFMSVQICGAFFNTHNVSSILSTVTLFQFIFKSGYCSNKSLYLLFKPDLSM